MTGAAEALAPDEVHVWHLDTHQDFSPAKLEAYEAFLTPEERGRRNRFVFEKGRTQYLLTRALVRTVLSAYAPEVAPGSWRFGANSHGRPHLLGAPPLPELGFNLSNTDGSIVCAVTRGADVGVDVERVNPSRDLLKLSHRFFSPVESAALRALPEEEHPRRFFEYWTLKEAYIKARGLGLAIPLDHFAFTLDTAGKVGITFTPELEDQPDQWQFSLLKPSPVLQLAVAVKRGATADRSVRLRPFLPPA